MHDMSCPQLVHGISPGRVQLPADGGSPGQRPAAEEHLPGKVLRSDGLSQTHRFPCWQPEGLPTAVPTQSDKGQTCRLSSFQSGSPKSWRFDNPANMPPKVEVENVEVQGTDGVPPMPVRRQLFAEVSSSATTLAATQRPHTPAQTNRGSPPLLSGLGCARDAAAQRCHGTPTERGQQQWLQACSPALPVGTFRTPDPSTERVASPARQQPRRPVSLSAAAGSPPPPVWRDVRRAVVPVSVPPAWRDVRQVTPLVPSAHPAGYSKTPTPKSRVESQSGPIKCISPGRGGAGPREAWGPTASSFVWRPLGPIGIAAMPGAQPGTPAQQQQQVAQAVGTPRPVVTMTAMMGPCSDAGALRTHGQGRPPLVSPPRSLPNTSDATSVGLPVAAAEGQQAQDSEQSAMVATTEQVLGAVVAASSTASPPWLAPSAEVDDLCDGLQLQLPSEQEVPDQTPPTARLVAGAETSELPTPPCLPNTEVPKLVEPAPRRLPTSAAGVTQRGWWGEAAGEASIASRERSRGPAPPPPSPEQHEMPPDSTPPQESLAALVRRKSPAGAWLRRRSSTPEMSPRWSFRQGASVTGSAVVSPKGLAPPPPVNSVSSPKGSPLSRRRNVDVSSPSRRTRTPVERSGQEFRSLVQVFLDSQNSPEEVDRAARELLFGSLPRENVQCLSTACLNDERSRAAFLRKLHDEGGKVSRIRFAWHLTTTETAAAAIEAKGIRCDDGHCACSRYGRGGYVATCAAKANAYAESEQRHLFLVLALPEEDVVRGERGIRPASTAADLPNHPTEYCFVDGARLHCVCRLDYLWAPTGRRSKADNPRAWRASSPARRGP